MHVWLPGPERKQNFLGRSAMLKSVPFRSTLVAVAMVFSASAGAEVDSLRKVDVPPGDLVMSLQKLAEQAGIELIYSADQLKGVRSQGVHGEYTTARAITELLRGTKFR